ncbi:hypothetical protein [Stenoxybacter acetivorans]|uniref:hypothetical protein n=1 Tax=Stenoxybacter acetivorans TaxID=422441 RepID=UPI00055AAA0D|nr:hypothetical protein [Stenoxybacter acetivorans]
MNIGSKTALCRAQVEVKYIAVSAGQNGSFSAGMITGVPANLYDTVKGLTTIVSSLIDTYNALADLIKSGGLGAIPQAIKQSYLDQISLQGLIVSD